MWPGGTTHKGPPLLAACKLLAKMVELIYPNPKATECQSSIISSCSSVSQSPSHAAPSLSHAPKWTEEETSESQALHFLPVNFNTRLVSELGFITCDVCAWKGLAEDVWNHLFQQQNRLGALGESLAKNRHWKRKGIEIHPGTGGSCHCPSVSALLCTSTLHKGEGQDDTALCLMDFSSSPLGLGKSQTATQGAAPLCPHLSKREQQDITEQIFLGERRPLSPVLGRFFISKLSMTPHAGRHTASHTPGMVGCHWNCTLGNEWVSGSPCCAPPPRPPVVSAHPSDWKNRNIYSGGLKRLLIWKRSAIENWHPVQRKWQG